MQHYLKNKYMNRISKIVILVIVVLVIICISFYKSNISKSSNQLTTIQTDINGNLPVLVDIGANTCIPCKKMAPILEELKEEYTGKVIIKVIDINKDRKEAERYNIKLIPTQILYKADGEEYMRHEGFISKEDLKQYFQKVGVE